MPNHFIKMIKLHQVFGLYGSGYGSRSISSHLVFPVQQSGSIFVFLMKVVSP